MWGNSYARHCKQAYTTNDTDDQPAQHSGPVFYEWHQYLKSLYLYIFRLSALSNNSTACNHHVLLLRGRSKTIRISENSDNSARDVACYEAVHVVDISKPRYLTYHNDTVYFSAPKLKIYK